MTDDRSFERAARSWLEIGPTEAPERAIEAAFLEIDTTPQERDWHVPWRLPKMTPIARALVGVAAVAVLLIGGVILLPAMTGPVGGTHATPTVSPAPSSVASRFALTASFTSPLMGYSIKVADDWTAESATTPWNDLTNNDPPGADAISVTGTDSSIVIASQPIPAGTTFAQWLDQFHQTITPGVPTGCDGGDPSTWKTVQIGPETGVVEPLCNAMIAFADVGGRVYRFTWGNDTFNTDQHITESEFKDVLKTVTFDPTGSAVPSAAATSGPVELTASFTSSTMGYTIPVAADWTATQATTPWVGVDNSPPMVDEIDATGTVSFIHAASQPIPAGTTFERWLVPFHAFTTANVPLGCDGGEPSTWKAIPVGQATGLLYHGCNYEGAVVEYGGRAYAFDLGNTTFNGHAQLGLGPFKEMLQGLRLTPETAVDSARDTRQSPSPAP